MKGWKLSCYFFAKKLQLYELVKTVSKVLRCENLIQILNALIKENEVNKLSEVRSTAKKKYKSTKTHKNPK